MAPAPTVLVDAENVRRSVWPNLGRVELLERSRAWASRQGARVIVVFDGEPPDGETEDVAGSGARSADDRIVELAATLERPLWLVTSDRELRGRVSPPAERVIGGGGFLRLLDQE
jgi:predicted RNA-binding protein with PIN domain